MVSKQEVGKKERKEHQKNEDSVSKVTKLQRDKEILKEHERNIEREKRKHRKTCCKF